MLIGVTGSIACGKSSVSSKLFKDYNYYTINCDILSRCVTESHSVIKYLIKKKIGDRIYTHEGRLDNIYLRSILLYNYNLFNWAERIIHPCAVGQLIKNIILLDFLNLKKVIEIPLLFEKKTEYLFDFIVCIFTGENNQLLRLNGIKFCTYTKASIWIKKQIPLVTKLEYSDFTITNNGDSIMLCDRTDYLVERLNL